MLKFLDISEIKDSTHAINEQQTVTSNVTRAIYRPDEKS